MKRYKVIGLIVLVAVLVGCVIHTHRESSPDNRSAPRCKVGCN